MFKSCTSLQDQQHADDENYLPPNLCKSCFDKCNGYHEFRIMCQESDRILQSFIEYVDEETLVDDCGEETVVAVTEQPKDEPQYEVEDSSERIELVDLNLSQHIIYDDESEVLEENLEMMEVAEERDGLEYLGDLESNDGVTVKYEEEQTEEFQQQAFYVEICCPACPRMGSLG